MRGGIEDAAGCVADLFTMQHGAAFQAFLDGTQPCLFASLTTDRTLKLAVNAPRGGTYAAVMYILKSQDCAEVKWNAATLTQLMQVRLLSASDAGGLPHLPVPAILVAAPLHVYRWGLSKTRTPWTRLSA